MTILRSSLRLVCVQNVRPHISARTLRQSLEQSTYPRRSFTTSTRHLKKSKSRNSSEAAESSDKPRVQIKYYDQLFPWSTERTERDPEYGYMPPEAAEAAKWLKEEIQKCDSEIREMEGEGGKTTIEPLLAALPKEDAEKAREAIRKSDREDALKAQLVEAAERRIEKLLPQKEELEILLPLPPERRPYLTTLNENLFRASRDPRNPELRKRLWQSYTRCKAFLPPFLHLVPFKAWSVLWVSQQSATPDKRNWAPHVVLLTEDMMEVGRDLNVYQKILYIEALDMAGHQQKAYDQWVELGDDFGEDQRASEEHELLGVRLFASHGEPEKAENLAMKFLQTGQQADPRILIPILRTWAQRLDSIGMRHAWALYLRFRSLIGDSITMDDYDNISMSFLNVGRIDLALAVFKDMMLTGRQTDETSTELYRKALTMMGRTQASAVTIEDLNMISLRGLTLLPRRFQNKYFYGCWLKKLIGMGAIDAASRVIVLMYERNVKPDTRHLNGIIGAWLRSKSRKDKEAAEKMAWAMIHERLDFVTKRRHGCQATYAELPVKSGLPNLQEIRQIVAPASIETLSLLLLYYGSRSQHENVQMIRDALIMAEIPPNVYFINQLLLIDLRRRQHQAAWIKYKEMFGPVKPDLETFACLWDCEHEHLQTLYYHSRDKFPNPRQLMSEMMNWFSSLRSEVGERAAIQEEFSKELYTLIIRCFAFTPDLQGTMVALFSMKESFNIYPDPETMQMIIKSVSRMRIGDPKPVTKPVRGVNRRERVWKQRKANVGKTARILDIVIKQRQAVLAKAGMGGMEELNDYIFDEEMLWRLAEFLRVMLRKTTMSSEEIIERKIEGAAWKMGVSGIKMDDPLPTYKTRRSMYSVDDEE
ncbi:hypothetical protein ACLMJK_006834 [Lecanora helva]